MRKKSPHYNSANNSPETQVQLRFEQAIRLHQQGQLVPAQVLYEAILQKNPKHFGALHLLGVIALQTNNLQNGVDMIGSAIQINPNNADAYFNRGRGFESLRQFAAAVFSYDQAIAIQPHYSEAYSNRGNALKELNQFDAAIASYDQAIAIQPDYFAAYSNRGIALEKLKQFDAAIASYDQAIAIQPDFAAAYSNRGNVLLELKRFAAAIASYDQAIAIRPDHAETYSNRGLTLKELGLFDAAIASYDQAIAIKPDLAAAYSGRGTVLEKLNLFGAAITSYDQAIAIQPDYAEAYFNRGNALKELSQFDAAIASYDQVIAIQPDFPDVRFNRSILLLLTGVLERAWSDYEWRWKQESLIAHDIRNFPQPRWLGNEPLSGKTILLYSEQGLGDTLQFCRYAKKVAALGARVILEAPAVLNGVLTSLAGVALLVNRGSPLPDFDYHCPLLSLPLAFKTSIDTIPAVQSYLGSNAGKVTLWQARLGVKTKLRVGLVWSGSSVHINDQNRSIQLSDLIGQLPTNLQYISLQKELREADLSVFQAHLDLLRFDDELHDFSDTAALCELMDVVISVDTSVAHLAGALGKPIWILLPLVPDWRWLLDRDDSPWYPTAKLYRQEKHGDWNGVFERVREDLRCYR